MRRSWVIAIVVVVAAALLAVVVVAIERRERAVPGCQAAADGSAYLGVGQAENAATIAGVGFALGVPDRAVTVALATAMQESHLANLPGGDRDSAGLFQQRPSQGWGTYAQVTDPVYAATTFYRHLLAVPGWSSLPIGDAAQAVQRSAAPDAYDQWEPQARSIASALTGESPATMTCHALELASPGDDVAAVAAHELGTSRLSGPQPSTRGWAIAGWLVAHATRLRLDSVTYDGMRWQAATGAWAPAGPADGMLSLHRAPPQ